MLCQTTSKLILVGAVVCVKQEVFPSNNATGTSSSIVVLLRYLKDTQSQELKCEKNLERFTNLRVILAQGPC